MVDSGSGEANSAPLVLALGDSLTAGYGLPAAEAFPARLESLLRERWPEARVLNAGVSRDTTADALRRLPRVLSSLRAKPDLAIVELGANDVLRSVSGYATRANLGAIVEELGRCAIPVLLATFEVPPSFAAFAPTHGSVYSDVAAHYGLRTQPFFPPGLLGRPGFVIADRIHPNGRAIALVAAAMVPSVVDMLAGR